MKHDEFLLVNNRIELLEPLGRAAEHHKMKCLECEHEWSSTPTSKVQAFKKRGVSGCPECNNARKRTTEQTLAKLEARGIQVLGEFNSLRTAEVVTFKNVNCGHVFDSHAGNVVHRNIDCPVCGRVRRIEKLRERNGATN